MSMSRAEFLEDVERLQESTELGGAPLDDVDMLLQELLKTRTAWSHEAVLALVYGQHGNKLASLAIICLVHGCKPRGPAPNHFVFAAEPFAKHCLERGRAELLKDIASRGIPVHLMAYKSEKVDNVLKRVNWKPRTATTDAGDALDVMSATEGTTHESFAGLLLELQSLQFTKPSVLQAGAKLISQLDPEHPDTQKLHGTPAGAFLTEESMRSRILMGTVGAPGLSAPPIEVRRRARMV